MMGVEPRWLWGATHDVSGATSSEAKGGSATSSSSMGAQGFSSSTGRNSMPLPADPTADEL
jgi:hypothetical protein